MSGVRFSQAAPLSNSPTGLNIGVQIDSLFGLNTANGLWTAEALRDLTDWANSIESQLSKATSNIFPEIAVLGDGGVLIGWIGSRDGFVGGWFKQLYVGGTDPTNAPLFADANGNVIIGQNGSISVRDIGGNEVGWEGVRTDTTLNISAATNASPTVVTVTAHGYVNGDTVFISGATGNTNINGYRIVEGVTANTFTLTDLVGAVINGNGVYGGSGTSMRYFAGAWFQSFAIGGTGFPTSKIRAFADGSVVINASLVVDSNGVTTSINNSTGGTAGTVGVRVKNDTAPSQDIVMTDSGFYIRGSDQFTYLAQLIAAGNAAELVLYNQALTKSIIANTGGGGAPTLVIRDTVSGTSVRSNAASITATNTGTVSTLGDTSGAGVVALRAKNSIGFTMDIEVSDTGYQIRATDQSTYIATLSAAANAGYLVLAGSGTGKTITLQSGGSSTITTNDSVAGTSTQLRPGVLNINGNQVVGPRGVAVTNPVGGTTTDLQARIAINDVISRLQAHGLIS